jgi:hypothetical protein
MEILEEFIDGVTSAKEKLHDLSSGKEGIGIEDLGSIEPLVSQRLSHTPAEAVSDNIKTEEGYGKAREIALLDSKISRWFTH